MEKYTMVKTEVQANGDIFLFYMDENGCPVESTDGITTIDQEQLQQLQENYVIEELPSAEEYVESAEITENIEHEQATKEEQTNNTRLRWSDEEVEKLLTFYIDNKEAFHNPAMKKSHLWTVACKTMLTAKNPNACDVKIESLKQKFAYVHVDYLKNNTDPKIWPYYGLCRQAFEDDKLTKMTIKENGVSEEKTIVVTKKQEEATTKFAKPVDAKVKKMLTLYLQYKKEGINNDSWQKSVWEKIAVQIGDDAEFWHKRFLNYKQSYIRMLEKRNELGAKSVTWPYMGLFDQIFGDDSSFKSKYGPITADAAKNPPPVTIKLPIEWNDTEKTVLVKYYFDCIGEFQDSSIPNLFLWTEVGRLLDKKPEECRKKYEELKKEHLVQYIENIYDLRSRRPISILFDNIISQEVEISFYQESNYPSAAEMQWEPEKLDEMVKFLFDNIEMFKDPICHFVCWAAVALKIKENVNLCKEQWNDLTSLYKSILNDKKEDPDLQIDWRYIEIFDRIFDYGMDTKLLEGYENKSKRNVQSKHTKIVQVNKAKRVSFKEDEVVPDNLSDLEPEEFEDKNSSSRPRGTTDPKRIKILEYYLKYKDKLGTTQRKKQAFWDKFAPTVGLSAEKCAQSFKELKQIYLAYIQREIRKPDKPILWPYFAHCKKAFGYRVIKNKLKLTATESDEIDEWTPREIKILINYFGQNREVNDSNAHEASRWRWLAKDINRSEIACRDKFLDLRKSYRKIITLMGRSPDCKINWKYFKFFDEIYSKASVGVMEVDSADDNVENAVTAYQLPANAISSEIKDEDLQCIIVIPEGEDVKKGENARIVFQKEPEPPKPAPKRLWTTKQKISLLKYYLEYLEKHKGKVIDKRDLMKEVSRKLNKPVFNCNRSICFIKRDYRYLIKKNDMTTIKVSPLFSLMHKIVTMKPKYVLTPRTDDDVVLNEQTMYQDVALPLWKIEQSLIYYLNHIEEFLDPKYDKKTVWINLGKSVNVRVAKIFKKINYVKRFFNSETNEVNGEKFEFADTLKEILEKEFEYRLNMGSIPEPMATDEEAEATVWTDEETEQLLTWYLSNLDKFKSSKYVPSYLWMEASKVLDKRAVACSKQMTEIRSQYSTMAKESPEELKTWKFYDLCQKIYGTGKKNNEQEQQQ